MTPHTPEGTVGRLTRAEVEKMCEDAIGLNNWTRKKAELLRDMALRPDSSGEAVFMDALEQALRACGWGAVQINALKLAVNDALPTLPAAEGWVSDDVRPELAEAVEHIERIGLAWDNVFPQVSIDGTVEHNPAAIKLNTAVKIARDWLIIRTSVQPKPQPKIPRTTHG